MQYFPIIGLLGPRQCGKTTLVKHIAEKHGEEAIYLDLESQRHLAILSEPELYFRTHQSALVVLDEIQVRPDLFPLLRSAVDEARTPGRFIILGSASPALLRQSNESLAGRVSYHELSPFNLLEIEGLEKHRLVGGYPDSFLAPDDIAFQWLENYIRSYVERELPALGLRTTPANIYKLLRMVSHIHGSLLNIENLSRSLGISATSVRNYLDFIENAFLIRRLQPFHINTNKRLIKSPKIYIRDSGVLHSLHGLYKAKELEFHPISGASWEGYCIEQIIQLLPETVQPYFYRTQHGAELDLILVKGVEPIATVEIKLTVAPKTTKGLHSAIFDIGVEKNFVIARIEERFSLAENIVACSLEHFITQELPQIL